MTSEKDHMITDYEKTRAEYVQSLETTVQHLQRQLQDLQAQAHWIPQVNNVMDSKDETVRTTLVFGGKRVTTTLPYSALKESSAKDAAGAVLDSFWENLIRDRFRELVEPELARSKEGVQSIAGAGKW